MMVCNSSVRISDSMLDRMIEEDVPYFDLTTHLLGIGDEPGTMEYFTRVDCVLCGTEEVARMATRLNCTVQDALPSSTSLSAGDVFMRLTGRAEDLHALWKVGLNLFDHLSAVATKTRSMVDKAHRANPRCEVLTTRKSLPTVKPLLTKAILTGGACSHRLGLSETVLVFGQHLAFMGGIDGLIARLPELRAAACEKKLFVEASAEDALRLARAGVDGIQLDKIPLESLSDLVKELRSIDPHLTLIATGGINPDNIEAFAATGVDGVATTAPYTAKPIDMSVRMAHL